jgi:hypothetical protein
MHAAGQPWIRDVLCYAGASRCLEEALRGGTSVKCDYVSKLLLMMDAVHRDWKRCVNSIDDVALGHTARGEVGGCVARAASVFGAVAAGVQTLTNAWSFELGDDTWTAGAVVMYVTAGQAPTEATG